MSQSFLRAVSLVADGCLTVLQRQLRRYLTGDLAEPSDEVLEETEHAPVHSIFAKETLAMVDSQVRRAPNASAQFIESNVHFMKNDTLSWLEGENIHSIISCHKDPHIAKSQKWNISATVQAFFEIQKVLNSGSALFCYLQQKIAVLVF